MIRDKNVEAIEQILLFEMCEPLVEDRWVEELSVVKEEVLY